MKTNTMRNRSTQIVHFARRIFGRYSWALAVLLFAGLLPVRAQQITGTIVGTVKDPTGALISTATVKATNLDTGFTETAKSNSYGEYRIDDLPVGRYTVVAEAANFKRFVQENLTLDVDQVLTLEIPLSIGATSDTVTVETAPPEINTSNAVLGRTVEPGEIIGLPLVNRNIYSEVSLTPGVMANNNSPSANPTGTPTTATGLYIEDIQINGSIDGGSAEVAFYLDGGNNITGMRNYGNPSPDPDAVEEFRVETSAFGAQYGQFSAAVVSVITKSGTNKFHGGLFEFNRNTDFNAYQWISPVGAPTTIPAKSRPGMRGTVVSCMFPRTFFTSLGLIAAAFTWTRTSSNAGTGLGTFSIFKLSREPVCWNLSARILFRLKSKTFATAIQQTPRAEQPVWNIDTGNLDVTVVM